MLVSYDEIAAMRAVSRYMCEIAAGLSPRSLVARDLEHWAGTILEAALDHERVLEGEG